MKVKIIVYLFLAVMVFKSCKKDNEVVMPVTGTISGSAGTPAPVFKTTPYFVKLPINFSPLPVPFDNPLTVEGVDLGRKLFYDKILSVDSSMSCGSCHNPLYGFTDNEKALSTGVSGKKGNRNTMMLFNLAWVEKYGDKEHRFFWDGRAKTLEDQVRFPIVDRVEMEDSMPNVLLKLQRSSSYPALFKKAFGKDSITSQMLSKAIAQFERTIISGNTRFDFLNLTKQEQRGMLVFNDQDKGDCFHCHNLSGFLLSSDFAFKNNGHAGPDIGLEKVTGNSEDRGKFRSASLRNLVFTAPYMHDGRFNTLEEVVEFYNSGASRVYPADGNITKHTDGLHLTEQDKADLVAFLKSITDSTLIVNPGYLHP